MREQKNRSHKMDDAYSYFSKKVDPIISPCVANFLFVQPQDIISALRSYFNRVKAGLGTHDFEDILCYNPKKSQKVYFSYNFGPIISKIIDMIATSQPIDVVDFICTQLAKAEFTDLFGVIFKSDNSIELETKVKSTRNKLNDAINLANSIASPAIEIIEKSKAPPKPRNEISPVMKQNNQVAAVIATKVKNIQITLLGMGGSGKTSIINALQGKFELKMKPSLGFKPTAMMLGDNINVKFYDLGGGPKIRSIWVDYYHDVHAIIYVFDSSLKGDELKESILLFQSTMLHASLSQKPLLIVANKQDRKGALTSSQLSTALNLTGISSTRISFIECSSFQSNSGSLFWRDIGVDTSQTDSIEIPTDIVIDPKFETGLELFLSNVEKDFVKLNQRVSDDIEKRKVEDSQKRIERERKVLKNKIALAFAEQIESSLLPENLPKANPDDCFGETDGIKSEFILLHLS